MLPQLRELERRFPDDVIVVGVHSGKFTGERDSSHIRDAAIRLNAVHATLMQALQQHFVSICFKNAKV